MLVSINSASYQGMFGIVNIDRDSNLEYDNEEKEEVGIATKLVKQEEKNEGEHIVLCGADFIGAEFAFIGAECLLLVLLRVVDVNGPVGLHPLSAQLPVHNHLLYPLPPSQHPSPRATCQNIGAVGSLVTVLVLQWPLCRCTHHRI